MLHVYVFQHSSALLNITQCLIDIYNLKPDVISNDAFDSEMFVRAQISLIFTNLLPQEFKVLANIENT